MNEARMDNDLSGIPGSLTNGSLANRTNFHCPAKSGQTEDINEGTLKWPEDRVLIFDGVHFKYEICE